MNAYAASALHVLIVHFNTPDLTCRLARQLPASTQSGRKVRIYILDNCSSETNYFRLVEGVTDMNSVEVRRSVTNLGFGAGINECAKLVPGRADDLVWILNPDTLPDEDCIGHLERALDDNSFNIVSPLIYSGHESASWIWFGGASLDLTSLRARHSLFRRPLTDAPQHPFETEFVTGAAPMMRHSSFEQIGGFPPNYFLYWEDAFFSWTARQLGLRLGVIPAAKLWHEVGASSGSSQSVTWYYWYTRNRFTFGRDIGYSIPRLAFGRGAVESLRPIGKALFTERKGRAGKVNAAIRGTVRGIVGPR